MEITLVGYGKMGRLIEKHALVAGHKIIDIVDPFAPEEKTAHGNIIKKNISGITSGSKKPDIAIEFSKPDAAADNIIFLAKEKIPVITGTTGWYARQDEVFDCVRKASSSLFWAPNFSIGMNLFYLLAEYAAKIFDRFSEYDAGGFEVHHNKKADSPSGTARVLAEKIIANMSRKNTIVYEMLDRPPLSEEFHFASLRTGFVPGVHSLIFDSEEDSIEIKHSLRNRDSLAKGALKAAEWLFGLKKRKPEKSAGVFSMNDMLNDILKGTSV